LVWNDQVSFTANNAAIAQFIVRFSRSFRCLFLVRFSSFLGDEHGGQPKAYGAADECIEGFQSKLSCAAIPQGTGQNVLRVCVCVCVFVFLSRFRSVLCTWCEGCARAF